MSFHSVSGYNKIKVEGSNFKYYWNGAQLDASTHSPFYYAPSQTFNFANIDLRFTNNRINTLQILSDDTSKVINPDEETFLGKMQISYYPFVQIDAIGYATLNPVSFTSSATSHIVLSQTLTPTKFSIILQHDLNHLDQNSLVKIKAPIYNAESETNYQ